MPKGVGAALRDAMRGKRAATSKNYGKVRGTLLNPVRLSVYSALTLTPCATVLSLSQNTGIPEHSIRWHLRALAGNGLVDAVAGEKGRFVACGHLREEDVRVMVPIAGGGGRRVFIAVSRSPGMTTKEIADNLRESRQSAAVWLRKLTDENILYSVRDGKLRRYFQSDRLLKTGESYSNHGRKFLDFMQGKMRESGVESRIAQTTLSWAQVELSAGKRRASLRVGINPYLTAFKYDNYV